MKKLLRTLVALPLAMFTVQAASAQNDVTSDYLENAGFDESDIWITDVPDNGQIFAPTAGKWTLVGTPAYGSSGAVGFANNTTINNASCGTNSYGDTAGGALNLSIGWGSTVQYTQAVTLPAGFYKLGYKAYNANEAASTVGSNLIGFESADGNASVYSATTDFGTKTWSEELPSGVFAGGAGNVSVGFVSHSGKGSGSAAKLFIDYVTLYSVTSTASATAPLDVTSVVGTAVGDWGVTGSYGNLSSYNMREYYKGSHFTGETFKQTISNLPNGIYDVVMYAGASCANITGADGVAYPAENITFIYANDKSESLTVQERTAIDTPEEVTLANVVVSDGTLTIGIRNDALGANWHIAQIKSLKYLGEAGLVALQENLAENLQTAKAIDQTRLSEGFKAMLANAISEGESVDQQSQDDLNTVIVALKTAISLANANVEVNANAVAAIAKSREVLANSTTKDNGSFASAIDDAQATLDTAVTIEAIDGIMPALETARQSYVLTAVPNEGHPFDYTFLVAGVGDSKNGWTANVETGSGKTIQNFVYKTSSEKDTLDYKAAGFIECWNGSAYDARITYTKEGLRNGHYSISAYAFTSLGGGTSFFANDKSVELDNTTKNFTKPVIADVVVSDGTLAFGLDMTKANWNGITNIELAYVSEYTKDEAYAILKEALDAYGEKANKLDEAGQTAYKDVVDEIQTAYSNSTYDNEEAVAAADTVAAAYVVAVASQNTPGADMTDILVNPQFSDGKTGWTCTDGVGIQTNNEFGENNTYIEKWNSSPSQIGTQSVKQVVKLNKGLYRLAAQVVARNLNATLYAKIDEDITGVSCDGAYNDKDVKDDRDRSVEFEVTKDGTEVEIGYETIGAADPLTSASSTAGWFAIDNVSLTYVADCTLTLSENSETFGITTDTYASVTLLRNMKSTEWSTFCVPFDMTDISRLGAVKKLTSVTNNEEGVVFNFTAATEVKAGEAYLVKPKLDVTTMVIGLTSVKAADPVATTIDGFSFVGYYSKYSVPQGAFYVNNDLFICAETENVEQKGLSAYITVPADCSAKVIGITVDGVPTTSIVGVGISANPNSIVDVFSLSGVRLMTGVKAVDAQKSLKSGMYIVNGKKVVIK